MKFNIFLKKLRLADVEWSQCSRKLSDSQIFVWRRKDKKGKSGPQLEM